MLTPYDWQEGIGHRAQYIESRLKTGSPVLAATVADGVLVVTKSHQIRKIFEVYDRIVMGGLGRQSDVDALRLAAVDFAHREGYNRSEDDVTIRRIMSALSDPMKRAFADFGMAPVVAKCVFASVADAPVEDEFYTIDYDGDFARHLGQAFVAGAPEAQVVLEEGMRKLQPNAKTDRAVGVLTELWAEAVAATHSGAADEASGLSLEAILVSRGTSKEDRFVVLSREAP